MRPAPPCRSCRGAVATHSLMYLLSCATVCASATLFKNVVHIHLHNTYTDAASFTRSPVGRCSHGHGRGRAPNDKQVAHWGRNRRPAFIQAGLQNLPFARALVQPANGVTRIRNSCETTSAPPDAPFVLI